MTIMPHSQGVCLSAKNVALLSFPSARYVSPLVLWWISPAVNCGNRSFGCIIEGHMTPIPSFAELKPRPQVPCISPVDHSLNWFKRIVTHCNATRVECAEPTEIVLGEEICPQGSRRVETLVADSTFSTTRIATGERLMEEGITNLALSLSEEWPMRRRRWRRWRTRIRQDTEVRDRWWV